MISSKEAIEEFKELYKKRYGKELSDEEASGRANRLFNLYKVVYMPAIESEIKKESEK